MVQGQIKTEPGYKMTRADKSAMKLIHNLYPVDRNTFRNTTPDRDDPYWIKGLHRYHAMDEDWIACDPPGPPITFIVTSKNRVFRNMSEALTSIRYKPRDDADALKAAVMIATVSAPYHGTVITSIDEKIEGIPEDILANHPTAPQITRNGGKYTIVIFSYVAHKRENKFVRGSYALWKHVITINGDTYKEEISILWEKYD